MDFKQKSDTALYFRKITLATVRRQFRGGYGGGLRMNKGKRLFQQS